MEYQSRVPGKRDKEYHRIICYTYIFIFTMVTIYFVTYVILSSIITVYPEIVYYL